MTDFEKEVQRIMDENGMTREQAERYIDSMGFESPFTDAEERHSAICPWKASGMKVSDFL